MFRNMYSRVATCVVCFAFGMLGSSQALAQQVYTNPYVQATPAQGALTGSADVISAQAKFMTDKEKAKLTQQQVEQAKVDTRRKVFDERRYELANTPPLQEEFEKQRALQLRHALNTPALTEIWSGDALNQILDSAIIKQGQGIKGPNIPLDQESLKHVSVGPGTGGSIAILRSKGGKLDWPGVLNDTPYDAERKEVDRLCADLIREASAGRVSRGTVNSIDKALKALKNRINENIDNLSPSEHVDACRYLKCIAEGVKAAQDPNAKNFFNDKWMAQGKTVAELVKYMREQGIRFAGSAGR